MHSGFPQVWIVTTDESSLHVAVEAMVKIYEGSQKWTIALLFEGFAT